VLSRKDWNSEENSNTKERQYKKKRMKTLPVAVFKGGVGSYFVLLFHHFSDMAI
jgi:hypothetical protein